MTSFEKWEGGLFCGFSLVKGSNPPQGPFVIGSGKSREQKQWEPDDSSDECRACGKAFSLYHRRHHCRSCGRLICSRCLLQEKVDDMVVKVCHQCSRLSKDILNQSLLDKWCAAEVSKMSDDEDMMKRCYLPAEITLNMFQTAAEGKSFAHTAVIYNDLAVVPNFATNGIDINATLLNDCTPLHLAAALGRLPMMKRLLENGADPTRRTLDGSLPIHYFCAAVTCAKKNRQGDLPVGKPAKKKGGSFTNLLIPSSPTSNNNVPLRSEGGEGEGAIERDMVVIEILRELNQMGAVHAETLYGESALHMACQGSADALIIRQLLRFGLDPLGVSDASIGSSPHEIAVLRNVPKQVIRVLQEAIVYKLLRAAQIFDKLTVLKCLDLPEFPSMNSIITSEDTTFLHTLCQKNPTPEIMEIILKHKSVDINIRDPFGWAPIHSVCKSSSVDLIMVLVEAGADLSVTNPKNVSALHYLSGRSFEEKDWKRISRLMTKLIRAVGVNCASSANETPLHYACQGKRDPFVTKILLENGASVLTRTKRGYSPLELLSLSENSHPGSGASPTQGLLATQLSQELFRGIRNNDTNLVKQAIDTGADVCSMGTKKTLPLFLAIGDDKHEIVKTILSTGMVDSCYNDGELSVLHFAVLHGSLSMISYLLETSLFKTTSETSSGVLPFHFFCRRSFEKETERREAKDGAILKKQVEIILDQLLDGVDVNCVNSRNETALHYLCGGHGDKNLLKRLLKKGADPNAMNTSFETPVSLCAVMRQPVILTKLLESFGGRDTTYYHKRLCYFGVIEPNKRGVRHQKKRSQESEKEGGEGEDEECDDYLLLKMIRGKRDEKEKEESATEWGKGTKDGILKAIQSLSTLYSLEEGVDANQQSRESLTSLREIRDKIELQEFTYTNVPAKILPRAQRCAALSLLVLWDWILATIMKFRPLDRFLPLRLIWSISRRREFSPEGGEKGKGEKGQYGMLLIKTYYFVLKYIGGGGGGSVDLQSSPFWNFFARFLPVLMFRLPEVGGAVVKGLKERHKGRGGWEGMIDGIKQGGCTEKKIFGCGRGGGSRGELMGAKTVGTLSPQTGNKRALFVKTMKKGFKERPYSPPPSVTPSSPIHSPVLGMSEGSLLDFDDGLKKNQRKGRRYSSRLPALSGSGGFEIRTEKGSSFKEEDKKKAKEGGGGGGGGKSPKLLKFRSGVKGKEIMLPSAGKISSFDSPLISASAPLPPSSPSSSSSSSSSSTPPHPSSSSPPTSPRSWITPSSALSPPGTSFLSASPSRSPTPTSTSSSPPPLDSSPPSLSPSLSGCVFEEFENSEPSSPPPSHPKTPPSVSSITTTISYSPSPPSSPRPPPSSISSPILSSQDGFRATRVCPTTPQRHFTFARSLSPPPPSKNNNAEWRRSLRTTSEQVLHLDDRESPLPPSPLPFISSGPIPDRSCPARLREIEKRPLVGGAREKGKEGGLGEGWEKGTRKGKSEGGLVKSPTWGDGQGKIIIGDGLGGGKEKQDRKKRIEVAGGEEEPKSIGEGRRKERPAPRDMFVTTSRSLSAGPNRWRATTTPNPVSPTPGSSPNAVQAEKEGMINKEGGGAGELFRFGVSRPKSAQSLSALLSLTGTPSEPPSSSSSSTSSTSTSSFNFSFTSPFSAPISPFLTPPLTPPLSPPTPPSHSPASQLLRGEKERRFLPPYGNLHTSPLPDVSLSNFLYSHLFFEQKYWNSVLENGWIGLSGRAAEFQDPPITDLINNEFPPPPTLTLTKSGGEEEEDPGWVGVFRTAEDQGEGGGGGKAFVLSFLEFWVDFVMVSLKDSGKSPMAMALRYGGIYNPLIWWHVPGYTLFTKELLQIIRESGEPEITKASSKFLLTDPDLLSQYLSILIPRTSAHSEKGVIHLFDCLGEWWKALKEHSIPLPESLNVDLLAQCFDILVEIDHHMSLNLLFSFLYTHLPSFSLIPHFRTKLVGEKILGGWFFHFFLHWDFKIRCSFYQILAFHIMPREQTAHPLFDYQQELENIQSWLEAKLKANINAMQTLLASPDCTNTFFDSHLEIYIPNALAEYQCYQEYREFWMERAPERTPPSILPLSDVVTTLKKNGRECEAFEKIRIPRPQVLLSLEECSRLKEKEIM